MKKRPWMPFYGMEYLTDTAHLTPAESGAYIHLIIYYWYNNGLPSDELAIAKITRLNPRAWRKSRDTLRAFFCDHWLHPRIERELAKAIEISNVKSANAKHMRSGKKAYADTLTLTHTKKDSANGFEGSKKEATEKKNWVWIAQGTEQYEVWKNWWIKTKGLRPPPQIHKNEQGCWFESEFPQ